MESFITKRISTLIGVVIILAVAVIAFVSILFLEKMPIPIVVKAENKVSQNIQDINNKSVFLISEELIIGAVDQLEKISLKKNVDGVYETRIPEIRGGYNINFISKGDLNNDGFEDAVVHGTICGASCGSKFTVILGAYRAINSAFSVNLKGFVSAGASQYHVDNIKIDTDGVVIISFNFPDYQGLINNETSNYKLIGKELIKLND